jgi:diguanylate cyclase (GGDEF)-like protein
MIALRGSLTLGTSFREESARERIAARSDREAAAADRERAAADRRYADLDELTGVFRRGAGELALTHEIRRSRRQERSLVVAVIDVDALKAVNDNHGHADGDALLRDVAAAITSTLRSYDVAVRWGGDEFVCGVSDVTLEVALERLVEIQRAFTALRPGASISAGLPELTDDDTLESLIARADTALYQSKAARGI